MYFFTVVQDQRDLQRNPQGRISYGTYGTVTFGYIVSI